MNASLKIVETGESVDLGNVSLIGRSSECQVRIADPRVSRRHAMIRMQDGGFFLFDLGSFNGSYLNGSRVTAARQLNDGDVITLAEHELQFQVVGAAPAENPEDLGGSTIALIRSTPVIILVSDIIGYTAMSEAIDADDLAQIIGRWYSDCEAIIPAEGGTVDKFIGDCVLAYWTKVDETTLAASMRAAMKLFESCEKIVEAHPEIFSKLGYPLEIGMALHQGKVAYGGMSQGGNTLVGDPVNLTFRLEALTRDFEENLLLSGDFARALPPSVAKTKGMGIRQVKGRAQPVEVFTLTEFPLSKD